MKKIKKIIKIVFYVLCFTLLIFYKDTINKYIIENYVYEKNTTKYISNEYAKKENFDYVQITDDFKANSREELLNIIYTILDSGAKEFTFYCDEDYFNCQTDIEFISNSTDFLTTLNNFIHPFNSYNKLYISTNNLGKVSITIDRLYNDEEIAYINTTIENIKNEILTDDMNSTDKIKAFHDYIIDATTYDNERAENIKNNIYINNGLDSHKASGVLKNKIALCSGYTDVMAVFLNQIGIKNFKISNESHIWNALNLNNNWYHLDLTWDDPVTSNGQNIIIYDFFIINDDDLKQKDTVQHIYDEYIYNETATSQN